MFTGRLAVAKAATVYFRAFDCAWGCTSNQDYVAQIHHVIFSLHKADLTLIEEKLTTLRTQLAKHPTVAKLFRYGRLDGEVNQRERNAIIDSFRGAGSPEDETHILLLTLHIGAHGLNLQEANVAIMYGHWYNPAVERQAMARVHRMGSRFDKVYCFDVRCLEGESAVMDRMDDIHHERAKLAQAVMESSRRSMLSRKLESVFVF